MVDRRLVRGAAVVAALLAAGIVAALRLDFGALAETTRFRDDAYYCFAWARSLAEGAGPCVSAGIQTSGVPFAWSLLLAAGGALLGTSAIPALAQALGLALHAATALGIAAALWRTPWLAAAAALLYAGNPFLLSEAQNGQETALACAALLALLAAVRRREAWFAVGAVLAVFARSDLLLVVIALALFRHGRSPRALFAPAVAALGLAAVSLALTGSAQQDSAWPMPWLMHTHFLAGEPDLGAWLQRLWWYLRPCLLGGPFAVVSPVLGGALVYVVLRARVPFGLAPLPLIAVLAAWALGASEVAVPLLAAALLLALRALEPTDDVLEPAFLGLAALVAAHHLVRFYPRDYYFAPFGVAGVLAIASIGRDRPRLAALLIVAAAALGVREARQAPRWPWQREMALAGRMLREVLGSDVAVGCFNSGIVSWLHPGPIVNLDGVVNREAFAALRRGALEEYLDARGVRFVLDTPVQFARRDAWVHASGAHFGADFDPSRDLREIARFDVPGVDGGRPGTDSFRLYWRVGRGAPPSALAALRDLGPAPGGGRCVLWPGRDGVTLTAGARDGGGPRTPLATGRDGVAFVLEVDAPALFESDRAAPVLLLGSD